MREVRLTSGMWVAAFVRRCQAEGAFAAVLHKGDPGAGAVFIEVTHADGVDLYGPAWSESERRFERLMRSDPPDVSARIDKERAFDRDLWVVSVDDREGRHHLLPDECA